ncbi:MAG: hypothetical protein LQ346_006354 [Caloplaca aetnensis]|nr:MAG: hypothetical protein LQ346_006354 [Caloplaca aetnensis]
MASQAPTSRHEASQQSVSPPAQPSASPQQGRSSPSHSTFSEDSQTVLLNTPTTPTPEETPSTSKDQPTQTLQRSHTASSAGEPRKCWICFSDETEDNPTSSEWRSPCPCALTAHEACLLDWIADKEAPQQNGSGRPQKIECPQCKAEIRIARPRSHIVEGYRTVEAAVGRLFWPGILFTLATGVGMAGVLHGASTVYMLFGERDARTLLGGRNGRIWSGNTILGLSSIPGLLMISSTNIADPLLPVLPIIYLAVYKPTAKTARLWPPSAVMTLAMLPYIRAVYKGLRRRLVLEREKEWARQIQPRGGEDAGNANDDGAQGQLPGDDDQGGGMNFELGVELEIIEEEEVPEEQGQHEDPVNDAAQDEQQGVEREHAQDDAHFPDQNPGQPEDQRQNPNPHDVHDGANPAARGQNAGLPAEQHRVVRLVPLVSAVVHSMMGALAFPAVAASMGGLISLVLPHSWKVPPTYWDRRSSGFLQSQFGRSVVGGCLFILLKDTLSLYSKYRVAQDHAQRRVLEYEGKDKKARAR